MASDTLVLTKVNETFLHIKCAESTAHELSAFFTFESPNAGKRRFIAKGWDGFIRLYNRKTSCVYVGLLPHIKKFAAERKYNVEYDKSLDLADDFSLLEAQQYADSLKIQSKDDDLVIRDYQYFSLLSAIRYRRMTLISPTSSGKSLIAYTIFRYLLEQKGLKKGLLIVPGIHLVEQMYKDFKDYSTANGYKVADNVHRIYEGQPLVSDKSLYISTWQSIHELPDQYFEQFDFIIGDEAHTFTAKSLKSIMTKSIYAGYRIAMTGTLDGIQAHRLVLEGLFGRVRQFVTTKQLMDRGEVAQLTIKCLFLTYPQNICKDILGMNYEEELDYILAHRARNDFIARLALSLKGNTLILFRFVDKHGRPLHELIESKIHRNAHFVYGGVEVEDREVIRDIVDKYPNGQVITASYGTFKMGVSIKNIHNIIFASPSKSRITVLQSIGRGLRMGEFKHACTLYDVIDDFSVENDINTTLDHFQSRLSYYKEQEFTTKFYNVKMKELV